MKHSASNHIVFNLMRPLPYPANLFVEIFDYRYSNIYPEAHLPVGYDVAVEVALEILKQTEQRNVNILLRHFRDGLSFAAIGREFNLSDTRVRRIKYRLCSRVLPKTPDGKPCINPGMWVDEWNTLRSKDNI